MAYIFLRIGTDPTDWVLESADPDTVAARLSQATGPVVLPVVGPLQGNLVEAAIEGRAPAAGPEAIPPVEAIDIPPVQAPDSKVPEINADGKQAKRP